MKRLQVLPALLCAFLLSALWSTPFVNAQEKTVVLCDVSDPATGCPGEDCECIGDTLEVTFDGDSQSVLQYDEFTAGMAVDVTIMTETVSDPVQGWSYGVAHDMGVLTLTSATTEGTDASALMNTGFDATSMDGIQTCGDDLGCEGGGRTEGGGWISAVVLSFLEPVALPAGRNSLAKATYTLENDVGGAGTVIEFSEDLAKQVSPPVALTTTVEGRARMWTMGVLGWVKGPDDPLPPVTEKSREICDPAQDPEVCVPDTLEVTFDGDTQSIYEYDTFTPGTSLTVTLVTDTKTEKVQGWSYGVAHDMAALEVLSATSAGTDTEALLDFGFDVTTAEDIETCGGDPSCDAANRTEGGGWFSAVVLSFTKPVELPLARNTIATADYNLLQDVGTEGTLIQVSGDLAKENSPPTDVNLTVEGKSRRWTTVVDGWVKMKGGVEPGTPFLRADIGLSSATETQPADEIVNITDAVRILRELFLGIDLEFDCQKAADVDDNGALEVTDSIHLLNHLFLGEAPPVMPFPEVGQDPTPDDGLTCEAYP